MIQSEVKYGIFKLYSELSGVYFVSSYTSPRSCAAASLENRPRPVNEYKITS